LYMSLTSACRAGPLFEKEIPLQTLFDVTRISLVVSNSSDLAFVLVKIRKTVMMIKEILITSKRLLESILLGIIFNEGANILWHFACF
jgi:hypothetical protein